MALRWYTTVLESTDHKKLADWWARALDWDVIHSSDDEVVILPRWAQEISEQLDFYQRPPGMVFVPVKHAKTTKNRIHLDFAASSPQDRAEAIAHLLSLGATIIDVGQPENATWSVFSDPEGNEFCILSARSD